MPRRASRLSPYRRAQLAARARASALGRDAVLRVKKAVADYADDIARAVASLSASEIARIEAGTLTFEASKVLARRLGFSVLRITEEGRALSFQEVHALWSETGDRVAKASGIGAAVRGRTPSVTMLGAYEALGNPANTWRTLLPRYAGAAGADVDQIVTSAIAHGIGPDKLARKLRPYVVGAETFGSTVGSLLKAEGITLSTFRGPHADAARQMIHNSGRIAFSEIHNARAEAEVQAFALDPLVRAIAWRLSPDRGTLSGPDECDAFADSDFYGLGAGNYPVTDVPAPPHPWDRCERVPIVVPSEAGQPKPLPPRVRGGSGAKISRPVSKVRADTIRDRVDDHLAATDAVNTRLRQVVRSAG